MKINKKIQKSVLRYPGGKSRAVETILKYIPENTKEIVSPFFGGGSIELACASLGMKVYGYDVFSSLVEFWQELLENPNTLVANVQKYLPLTKEQFYQLQKDQINLKTKTERASAFYVLNRSSFSGSTLSGGMSPNHPRFNQNSIDRLKDFKIENLSVDCLDFEDSILLHPDKLLYLDPPYLIKEALYGKKGDTHKNFNHKKLFELLSGRDNWILSYNDCPEIREMYKDYKIICPEWKYGMSDDKNSREVLIFSKDLINI